MSDLDRSHPATPMRRARARAEGLVPRSHDLSSAAVLLAGAGMLIATGPRLAGTLAGVAREQWGGGAWIAADRQAIFARLSAVAGEIAHALAPLLGVMLVVGLAVELAQTGFLVRPERLNPDWNRVNPLVHVGRLFSWAALGRVASGLTKAVLLAAAAWFLLADDLQAVLMAGSLGPGPLADWFAQIVPGTLAKLAGVLLAWGAVDYGLAWLRHERSLAMTSQELREEMREMGGSRKAVARRKPLQTERTTEAVSSIGPS